MDLESTVFTSKSALRVDVDFFHEHDSAPVQRIRATADGRSCAAIGTSCVIEGLNARRGTTVNVDGLDANGNVVTNASKRLVPIRSVKKIRSILCYREGKRFQIQVAGLPFNYSSAMKARVKLAPIGKPLPAKWKSADSSWIGFKGLKVGKRYQYKAQAWNALGWSRVRTGTVVASPGCE